MRFLSFLCFSFFLAGTSQADTWSDYINIVCDEDAGVFEVWDYRLFDGFTDNKTPDRGESFSKTGSIKYKSIDDDNFGVESSGSSVFKTCTISYKNRDGAQAKRVFSVKRTGIDSGNVQRQCGAANSAEITVFVDNQPVAIYPSAKDDCYNGGIIDTHPRLKHENNTLRICMNTRNVDSGQGLNQLIHKGEICSTGFPEAHIADFKNRPERQVSGPNHMVMSVRDVTKLYEDQKKAEQFERFYNHSETQLKACQAPKGFWAKMREVCPTISE